MIKPKLHILLAERYMTVNELHRRSGVAYQTLYKLYHGKGGGLSFNTIDQICRVLNVTPGDLLEYVPDNK